MAAICCVLESVIWSAPNLAADDATPGNARAGAAWTPVDDWRDANELETFSSICEEPPPTPPLPPKDDGCEEGLVVDVDAVGDAPTLVSLPDGTRLKLVRVDARRISIELIADDGKNAAPCGLRTAPPPLPPADYDAYDPDLARFQSKYARLVAQGRLADARALAVAFLSDWKEDSDEDPPCPLPARVTEDAAGLLQHRVSFNGKLPRYRTLFPSHGNAVWPDAASRRVTFSFRGATIDQAAEFFRVATGLSIEVDVSTQKALETRLHLALRDATMETALEAVCRAAGLVYTAADERIVLTEAESKSVREQRDGSVKSAR
jgi:hypothetical protein